MNCCHWFCANIVWDGKLYNLQEYSKVSVRYSYLFKRCRRSPNKSKNLKIAREDNSFLRKVSGSKNDSNPKRDSEPKRDLDLKEKIWQTCWDFISWQVEISTESNYIISVDIPKLFKTQQFCFAKLKHTCFNMALKCFICTITLTHKNISRELTFDYFLVFNIDNRYGWVTIKW